MVILSILAVKISPKLRGLNSGAGSNHWCYQNEVDIQNHLDK